MLYLSVQGANIEKDESSIRSPYSAASKSGKGNDDATIFDSGEKFLACLHENGFADTALARSILRESRTRGKKKKKKHCGKECLILLFKL